MACSVGGSTSRWAQTIAIAQSAEMTTKLNVAFCGSAAPGASPPPHISRPGVREMICWQVTTHVSTPIADKIV